MDFRHIEAFCAVAENKSFSKAADTLFLTQPTISAHIAHLENELGAKLILRTTRDVALTECGQLFYEYCQKLLSLREEACGVIHEKIKGEHASVVIAASTVPAQCHLPKLLSEFRQENPDVTFNILLGDSHDIEMMVHSGKAEVGLIGQKAHKNSMICSSFAEDKLVVITPNTKRYQCLQGSPFPLGLLFMEPYISRETGSGTRSEIDAYLRHNNYDPSQLNVVAVSDSTENIKNLVSQGVGLAIISKAVCDDYILQGLLLCFDLNPSCANRKLYVIKQRNGILSKDAQHFYKFVTKHS